MAAVGVRMSNCVGQKHLHKPAFVGISPVFDGIRDAANNFLIFLVAQCHANVVLPQLGSKTIKIEGSTFGIQFCTKSPSTSNERINFCYASSGKTTTKQQMGCPDSYCGVSFQLSGETAKFNDEYNAFFEGQCSSVEIGPEKAVTKHETQVVQECPWNRLADGRLMIYWMDDSPSVDLSLSGTVEVVEAQTSPPTSPGEHIQVGDDDDDEDRYRGKPRPIPIWLIVFVVAGLALCVAGFITFGACFIWHYVRSSKREAIRAAKKNQKSEIGKELKQKKEQAEEKIQDEVFEQSSINIREAKAKAEEKDKKTGDLKEEMQQELNRDKKLN